MEIDADRAAAGACAERAAEERVEQRALCRALLANHSNNEQLVITTQPLEHELERAALDAQRSAAQNVDRKAVLDQAQVTLE